MPDHFFFFLYVFFKRVPFAGSSFGLLMIFRRIRLIVFTVFCRILSIVCYISISAEEVCYTVLAVN